MTILVPVVVVLVIVVSTVLHELAHGFVAYKLGDNTAKEEGRLTLNPIKHIDPYMSILVPVVLYLMRAPIIGGAKPVPVDRRNLKGGAWGMALVAACGPLTNLLIAFIVFVIGVSTGILQIVDVDTEARIMYAAGSGVQQFLTLIVVNFVQINIVLAMFNLLPLPPLDGSRVVYAIAPDGVRDFLDRIEPYSMMILLVVILFLNSTVSGVVSNLYDGILNFFIMLVKLVI